MQDFGHRRREEVVENRRDLSYPLSIGWCCPSSKASVQNAIGSNCGSERPNLVWP
jgi:hypothetical protein